MSERLSTATDALPIGAGVCAAVLGYAAVASVTGIEASASLETVLRPGALGLLPGGALAGWLDGGSVRRSADTGFRAVFVATALAQGALWIGVDAPLNFLLLGLMGASLTYALPGAVAGAVGGALRQRWDRTPEVGVDV